MVYQTCDAQSQEIFQRILEAGIIWHLQMRQIESVCHRTIITNNIQVESPGEISHRPPSAVHTVNCTQYQTTPPHDISCAREQGVLSPHSTQPIGDNMRKSWTLFWNFFGKRITAIDSICDNLDKAMIEGSAALADVAQDLRIKEEV